MYECKSRLPCLILRSSELTLNSARGGSKFCLSRDLKNSNDPETYGSCNLRPRPKSLHALPSSVEQMRSAFSHRRYDEPLWHRLVPRTIAIESLHRLPCTLRCQSLESRVMCIRRHGSSGLLLSQQFKLLSTMFSQQLYLLRTLLVKQGYFSARHQVHSE